MRCPGCDLFHPTQYDTCINCGIKLASSDDSKEGAVTATQVEDEAAPRSSKRRSKNLQLESRAGSPAMAALLTAVVIVLLVGGATFFFLTRSSDDQRLLQKGRTELDKGQYAFAVGTLKKAIDANPNSPQAHLLIARAYVGIDKIDDAWKEVDKAQKLGKGVATEPELASELANYYRLKKQYDKSIDLIKPLADKNLPGKRAELSDLNALQGDEALNNGNLEKALKSWELVQEMKAGVRYGEAQARLATIYEKLAKKLAAEKKDDEALSYLAKLTAISKNPKYYETAADIYERKKSLDSAIGQLREALELSNSQRLQRKLASLLARRGKEMLDNGQQNQGYAYLQQARSIDPSSALPEVTLKKIKVTVDKGTKMPMITGEVWNPNRRSVGNLTLKVELYDSKKLVNIYEKETRLVDEFTRPLKARQSKNFSFISDTYAPMNGNYEFKVFINGSLYKAYKYEKWIAPVVTQEPKEKTDEKTEIPKMPPLKLPGSQDDKPTGTQSSKSSEISPEEKTLRDLDF